MSISPITSSLSYSTPVIQEGSVQSSSQQQPAQFSGRDAQEDTVQLSQVAQIQQMAQQGESASSIASNMGLTVSEVDSDLGISTTSPSVPVAAPSGHGGGHSAASAPASDATVGATGASSTSKAAVPAPSVSVQA